MRIEESNNELLDLNFPIPFSRIGVEINQKCNLHCTYCWNQKWNNSEINIHKLKCILTSIQNSAKKWPLNSNPLHLSFYAAEPLLSPEILLEILNYPFYFSILTNGTLLKDEWNNILNKPNINISISLDGIKENHNYFRGNSFDTIVYNINHFPTYSQLNVDMTVNIKSLTTLYQSLEFLYSLPVAKFECHLNLYDAWTEDLFQEYINILLNFITNYSKKITLPGYELEKRFANFGNAKIYQKDRGGPLHQIDIEGNIMIQKPHRSCLILPDKKDLFYGKKFANEKGFYSSELQQQYLYFMNQGFSNYNFISNNCNNCNFHTICEKNREIEVFLYEKECYPLLEHFILYERFWK